MRNPPIISSVLVVSDKREFALIVCVICSAKLGHALETEQANVLPAKNVVVGI